VRRRRRPGVVAALVLLASVASATVIVPMRDETLVAGSDLIVTGAVASVEAVLLAGPRVVTRVTVRVERTLSGEVAGPTIVVTEPGGAVAGLEVTVPSAPAFAPGERVLLFLRSRPDGSLATTALGLGKFALATASDGSARARRAAPLPTDRALDELLDRIARTPRGRAAVATDGRAGAAIEPPRVRSGAAPFSLVKSRGGNVARWFEADCGLPITIHRAGAAGGDDVTSDAAVTAGAAAWTDAPASIALAPGDVVRPVRSVIDGAVDGRNEVVFDDPFREVTDLTDCQGILAETRFVASGDARFPELGRRVNGRRFGKLFEADVVVNPGIGACTRDPLALSEVVGHELGHVIGLGHSSEKLNETNPAKREALMYFAIHADGRGARLAPDDVAGVAFIYPEALVPRDPIGKVACEVGLGLLSTSCFGEQLAAAPFHHYRRAVAAARKATRTTAADRQQAQLGRALAALDAADRAAAARVAGACGADMRTRLQSYRDRVAQALATFTASRRNAGARLAVSGPGS